MRCWRPAPVLPALLRALPGQEAGHRCPSPSREEGRPAFHSSQRRLRQAEEQTVARRAADC